MDTYTNKATAGSQALVIFLLDISGSMGKPMAGKTRIQVVKESLKVVATEMVQRSLRNRMIRPRYKVGMIAYTDDVYDIYNGIITIDAVAKMGVPDLKPFNRTDVVKGFKYVRQLLAQELANYNPASPAPLIIHMTDAEFKDSMGDPEPIIREIQQMEVPDGHVLVENIYISDALKVTNTDPSKWPGYQFGDSTGSSEGDKLLSLSSRLPETYRQEMAEMNFHLNPNSAMMFPGIHPEFVQMGFVMSMASQVTGMANENTVATTKTWESDD